jgi:hypothetical protein
MFPERARVCSELRGPLSMRADGFGQGTPGTAAGVVGSSQRGAVDLAVFPVAGDIVEERVDSRNPRWRSDLVVRQSAWVTGFGALDKQADRVEHLPVWCFVFADAG